MGRNRERVRWSEPTYGMLWLQKGGIMAGFYGKPLNVCMCMSAGSRTDYINYKSVDFRFLLSTIDHEGTEVQNAWR